MHQRGHLLGKTTEDQLTTQPIPDPEKIGMFGGVVLYGDGGVV